MAKKADENHIFDGRFFLKAGRYIIGDADCLKEKIKKEFDLKPIDSIFSFEFFKDKSILQCNLSNLVLKEKLVDEIEIAEFPIESNGIIMCSADCVGRKIKNTIRFASDKDFYVTINYDEDLVISCQVPKTPSPFRFFATV